MYLGVLIITLVIFLTPTIAMYYYFCFIYIIVSIMIDQILLLNLQTICTNFPSYLLLHTLLRPYSLPNSYSVQLVRACTFRIVPSQCNKGSVFSHMVEEFKLILREVAPNKVIGMIFRGDNLFYVMRDLLNITNRQQSKEIENNGGRQEAKEEVVQQSSGIRAKVRYFWQLVRMLVSL